MATDQQIQTFLEKTEGGTLLQSGYWQAVQKASGLITHMISVKNKNQVRGVAMLVRYDLPFGLRYFYCPRGPVVASKEAALELLQAVSAYAVAKKAAFVRFDPASDAFLPKGFAGQRYIRKGKQPAHTVVIDVSASEDDILASMKSKTRYNVRLAERKGVKIVSDRHGKYLSNFLKLSKETAARDGFSLHPDAYYDNLLKMLAPAGMAELLVATFKNRVVAVNLLTYFGTQATYLHGASSGQYRSAMPTYLLQWEAIKRAKAMGCHSYDLAGVAKRFGDSQKEAQHGAGDFDEFDPWFGITRFKTGFGGRYKSYPQAFDMVLSSFSYALYRNMQKLRGRF